MSWLLRFRLRSYIRNSLWPTPVAAIPVALAAVWLSRSRWTEWRVLGFAPEGARALLGGLVPAALTFVVLILSTLLLSIQLASSQFSPRLIGGLLTHRPIKLCLGVFTFSFVYGAGALGRVESHVPQFQVLMAILCTVVSVGVGLYLVDYMAKELRPIRLMVRTATMGSVAVKQMYPRRVSDVGEDPAATEPVAAAGLGLPGRSQIIANTRRPGVLLELDVVGMCALAESADCRVDVVPRVGDFVAVGEPLFRVQPPLDAVHVGRLLDSLALGDERTPEQDPEFAFRILVDVACKALSPAVNDPTTAVIAIDQIQGLLRLVGLRRLDVGERRDGQGNVRLTYPTPSWIDFVLLAVMEIRHYGSDSIQVTRRLKAMLTDLASVVPPDRAVALLEQLALLQRGIERRFPEPADRMWAATSDTQGIGGLHPDAPGVCHSPEGAPGAGLPADGVLPRL